MCTEKNNWEYSKAFNGYSVMSNMLTSKIQAIPEINLIT